MNWNRLGSKRATFFLGTLAFALGAGEARAQYGAILPGAGAINRSFAGVATAAPLSAAGALYWNPATLTGLNRSELEAGAELLFPHTSVSSNINAGAFGPGTPPVGVAGRSSSDSTIFALPTVALAYTPEDSRFTFGFGLFSLAGFGVDYAGSGTNPLLTAPPPNGLGFGPVYSEFQVLHIVPAVAYRLTDRLSVSVAPTLNLATLRADPGIFGAPDDANRDGFATYPRAAHGRTVWGAGATAGLYYQAQTWNVGASVKSPQWFDTFHFNATDEVNRPRTLNFDLDLPMIVSLGAAYTGLPGWLLAADVRYIDYASTAGFGEGGFNPDGSVRGLGWKSIWTAAAAAQYKVSDALSVRAGYSWNTNPVPNAVSLINTVAPTIGQHMVTAGLSWNVTEDLTLSLAYSHVFENAISGPVLTPSGPVPGTSVRNSESADSLVIGANLKFGGPRRCGTVEVAERHPAGTTLSP